MNSKFHIINEQVEIVDKLQLVLLIVPYEFD